MYIPIDGVDTARQQVVVRLRDTPRTGTALLVYSSHDCLIAAHGGDHPGVQLPSRELPSWQRQLGFNVVLLDVGLLTELRRSTGHGTENELEQVPAEVDPATGEPLVYVPSRPYRAGDSEAQLELQPLADGQRALLTYSSKQSLLDGCGPEQYFVRFSAAMVDEAMRQCGADRVLIDTPLPDYLRHR